MIVGENRPYHSRSYAGAVTCDMGYSEGYANGGREPKHSLSVKFRLRGNGHRINFRFKAACTAEYLPGRKCQNRTTGCLLVQAYSQWMSRTIPG